MGGRVISDTPWWLRPWLFIIFTRSEADISDTALSRLLLVSAANSAAALWRLVLAAALRAVLRQLVLTAALRAVRRRQILIRAARAENWTAVGLRRRLIIRAILAIRARGGDTARTRIRTALRSEQLLCPLGDLIRRGPRCIVLDEAHGIGFGLRHARLPIVPRCSVTPARGRPQLS